MGLAAAAAGVALVAGAGCDVPCACAENPMNTPSIPTPIAFFHANFMLETFLREHFAVPELEARRTHFVGVAITIQSRDTSPLNSATQPGMKTLH